jgi:cytochrome b561
MSQMTLTNTQDRYGWLTILLHWIVVVSIVVLSVYGLTGSELIEAGDRTRGEPLLAMHVSLGAALFAVFALRIIAYLAQKRPAQPKQAAWLNGLSVGVHYALLLGILIQILSGPLMVWSEAHAISVFGLFEIPSPFMVKSETVHEAAELGHVVGRAMIFFALIVHLAGAFKHLIFDRDGVFSRMLRPGQLRERPRQLN